MNKIHSVLIDAGLSAAPARFFSQLFYIVFILLVCILATILAKSLIRWAGRRLFAGSRREWGEILRRNRVFDRAAHLIAPLTVNFFSDSFPAYSQWISRGVVIYVIIVLLITADAALNAADDIYRTFPVSKAKPIKGFLQAIKICLYIVGFILILAELIGKNPIILLGGVSALAAVITIVFRDSLLGFVAGIQLTSNDMVRIGDWIEMPKYNADGTVIELSLNTVKVENFDRTITTIPAYAMISDSFRNWRGMVESGGRRIKRAVYIDTGSIRPLSPELLARLRKIDFLSDYINTGEKALSESAGAAGSAPPELAAARHLTNIGAFRAYVQGYLQNHPGIRGDMAVMVRQLPCEGRGLPLEIYAFTKNTDWAAYENTQSDIFDHLLCAAPVFGLVLFQQPAGSDIRQALGAQEPHNTTQGSV